MKHISISYILFGNFTSVFNNIVNISNYFENFRKSISNEVTGSGNVLPIYCFSLVENNKIVHINIHSRRIDFLIEFADPTNKSTSALNIIVPYVETIKQFADSKINRMAINSTYFDSDANKDKLKKLFGDLNLAKNNDDPIELNVRFTTIAKKSFCERINNICTIGYGPLTNANTFVTENGISVFRDVNTAVGSFEGAFDVAVLINHFKELEDITFDNSFLKE